MSALLAAGAGSQLEAPSYTGLRPLQCAADFLRADTVAQLLQLGARVDVRDRQGAAVSLSLAAEVVHLLTG